MRAENWKRFELVVARIQRALDPGSVVDSAFVSDRTAKRRRQVDVRVRGTVGGQAIVILIECRDHRRKVDVGYVESVATKARDVGAHKALIVSATGYTSTAREKAAAHGIVLLTLKSAPETDWPTWLGARELTAPTLGARVFAFALHVREEPGAVELDLSELAANGHLDEEGRVNQLAPLLLAETGESWNVLRVLNGALEAGAPIFDDVPETGEEVRKEFSVELKPPMRIKVRGGGFVLVHGVGYDVGLSRGISAAPFRLAAYADEHQRLAEYAEATLLQPRPDGTGMFELTVALVRTETGQVVATAEVEVPRSPTGRRK